MPFRTAVIVAAISSQRRAHPRRQLARAYSAVRAIDTRRVSDVFPVGLDAECERDVNVCDGGTAVALLADVARRGGNIALHETFHLSSEAS
jgi:hypothetical protein